MSDKTTAKDAPAPAQPQVIMVKQTDPGQALAEAMVEAEALNADETIPGGRYLAADGRTLVDANGVPLKDAKKDDG